MLSDIISDKTAILKNVKIFSNIERYKKCFLFYFHIQEMLSEIIHLKN